MPAHLARGTEVRRLYRKGLELSRLFPDPCGRNYLMRRVQEVFRKRATETSPTKIGRHIKEGAQSVRRMERALHARADYERVTQLAYGVVGRVKHALASALAEINVSSSPNEKPEKTRKTAKITNNADYIGPNLDSSELTPARPTPKTYHSHGGTTGASPF